MERMSWVLSRPAALARIRSPHRRAEALRRAVAELPAQTRMAMLEAIDGEELIAGAYTDRSGRICPMLAAYRRGARAEVGAFPGAWDEFAGARRPRPATRRELEILKAVLQENLAIAGFPSGAPSRPAAVSEPSDGAPVRL